jgi:hypothetical protein
LGDHILVIPPSGTALVRKRRIMRQRNRQYDIKEGFEWPLESCQG